MPAYAIANLQDVDFGPDIVAYLQAIDPTLAPFEGVFLLHGSAVEVVEGPFVGDLVVIAFPDLDRARAWYRSAAYQAILPLRTRNARCWAILADGVVAGHRAVDLLDRVAA
ncbi:MAG: DUF1330 domain-containing protein [Gemmatimonadaceae bacterium]|nr:DUF1330 domain-containing protein [Acetobacteraceae bacterium]